LAALSFLAAPPSVLASCGVVSVAAGALVDGAAAAAGAAPPTLMTCGGLAGASSEPRPPISTPTPSARTRQATPATAAAFALIRPNRPCGPRRVVVVVVSAAALAGTCWARTSRNGRRASARRVPQLRQ
jgi:hypothetical protein